MTPSDLSAYAENRPPRTESQRHQIAQERSAHLPKPESPPKISNPDLDAMKAAFIKRWDDDLPGTEALMAVAMIGYRMALRDMAKEES